MFSSTYSLNDFHSEGNIVSKWRRKYVYRFVRDMWNVNGYNLENAEGTKTIDRKYSSRKMSSVCNNFVQNAWKKDFCSNCFKSRDEHTKVDKVESGKYHALPFQNRSTYFKTKPRGILKITSKKNKKGKVSFPVDVSVVIGYGGDDWSDGEDFELSEDITDDDTYPDTEDERELHKLTKMNTDFNTVKANLLSDGITEAKKSYTSLLLGKIQKDSEGKKKTLMVSVTPFGQDSIDNNKSGIKTHERKAAIIPVSKNSENISSGYKTNIILSSFIKTDTEILTKNTKKEMVTETNITEKSLLEEISETLEQNRITTANEFTSKPTVVKEQMKEDVKTSFNDNRDNIENNPKKNGLVRNLPIAKTQERPKVNTVVRPEFKFCKINIENNSENLDKSAKSESLTGLDSTNNSFTSDDDSFSTRTDSDDDIIIQAVNITKMNEESLKIKVFNDCDDENRSIDTPIDDIRRVDGQSDSLQDTFEESYTSTILDMPPIIPKITRTDIFSGEVSRESAGEPDGRADPDDTMEAPALPSSPIPTSVDPRPSFLHGMILDSRPTIPEKPKLPAKPLSVLIQTKRVTAPPQHNTLIMQLQQTLNGTKRFSKDEEIIFSETIVDRSEQMAVMSKPPLIKQDSDSSLNQSYNKRKAPRPPPSPSTEEIASNKYQRNPTANVKSDSPVVREKEKRERATSSPKSRQAVNGDSSGNPDSTTLAPLPEPAPRRNISLSHDNLLIEDKRKGKYKFSIKKLLRMGSSKDLDKKDLTLSHVNKLHGKTEDVYDIIPKPKPRLVIIHPLDLNGGSVEVVRSNNEISEGLRRLSHDDASSIYSGSSSIADVEISLNQKIVPSKPPPPPRNISQARRSSLEGCPVKPARPPPPKSAQLQRQQKQPAWTTPVSTSEADTVYANLGEVRSAIAPKKPERTASMREREAQLELPKRRNPLVEEKDESDDNADSSIVEAKNKPIINNYDDVYNSERYENDSCLDDSTFDSGKNNSDSDYEYVNHNARSSSPECDSTNFDKQKTEDKVESRIEYRIKTEVYSKSDVETNTDYNKSFGTFRATSLPYCGSETESEIYSPYSFYSCADVTEDSSCTDDYNGDGMKNTTSKLRVRKGRSIVHKSLEDNYGAVVIANHEALAQVLEQVQQSAIMQPSLRGIKACSNLRWSDFALTTEALSSTQQGAGVTAGKRVFVAGVWRGAGSGSAVPVTLMLHKEQMSSQLMSVQGVQPPTLRLHAVTEFCDLVPLQIFGEDGEEFVQATVVVLERTQIDTVHSFGEFVRLSGLGSEDSEDGSHEATFVLLQLVDGLKSLQARGVEEIARSLSSFVICRARPVQVTQQAAAEDRLSSIQAPKTNTYGRLCLLQGLSEEAKSGAPSEESLCSLCSAGAAALEALGLHPRLAGPLRRLLQRERAHTLSQAKAVLEFALWGPRDVVLGLPHADRELSLQRWLDLERATVLHGLVGTRVQLNSFEQSHLTFLVRSNAKVMCEASVLLENIEG